MGIKVEEGSIGHQYFDTQYKCRKKSETILFFDILISGSDRNYASPS